MSKQRMVSETRGIGSLLTERRYFAVPAHQRDYAWRAGEVEEYLDDVVDAIHGNTNEYFLGLIVLVDTDDSTSKRYEILDGQQRLATTTMIYAAIRHWLTVNGFNDDATRIQNDFIGISEIGENEHEPRIIMNIDNREIFQEIMVNQCNDELIERRRKDSGRQPKGLDAPVRAETAAHVLLELDGGEWVEPIQLMGRAPTRRVEREATIRRWLSGTAPSQRQHLLVAGDAKVSLPLAGHVVESQRAPSRYTAEIEVEAGALATFLLKVTYHPGWRVRVDSRPAELLHVSPDMMAVQVGPGRHRLAFEFRRPWWSFALLAGSLLSLGLLVRRERRRAITA